MMQRENPKENERSPVWKRMDNDHDDDNDTVPSHRVDYYEENEGTNGYADGGHPKEDRSREEVSLLSKDYEVLLTSEMEEEIVGPESFTTCGIGPLTSAWLQKLACPEMYLVVFSLSAFAQGIFFTYSSGTLTTVEKRFKLPSSVSGFISTGNDILQLFLSIPLAYAAGYGHRPRWLGIGLLLSAVGSFIIMTPHLIYGAGDYSHLTTTTGGQSETTNKTSAMNKDWAYCGRGSEGDGDCSEESTAVGVEQYTVAALQFLGSAMSGLANVCFYVVGYSYMDESVSKDKIPIYFAVAGCMRVFGPVVGTALASYTVGIWVELGVQPTIKPTHPQWVGAWWLGYPIIMFFLVLASVPMMFMPRQLPGTRKRTLARLRASAKKGKEAFETYKGTLRPLGQLRFRDILPGFVRLSKNKLFLIISTNQTLFWFGVVGFYMFEMKYKEHQFKISASESNRVTAIAGIIASMSGWLGMGSLLTFFKPRSKNILFITMGVSICCLVVYLGQMQITCERDHVIGLDKELKVENLAREFYTTQDDVGISSCMADCYCPAKYSPVCVNSTYLFFSGCHAGCRRKLTVNGSLIFEDCLCSAMLTSSTGEVNSSTSPHQDVRSGFCSTECDNFIYFVVGTVFSGLFVSSNRVIANIIVFRSLDERDKDLALGILNLILSLAFTLVPILVGGLVDYCCILWERTCGHRGYCYLYDLDQFRWIIHAIPAAGMLMSFATEFMLLRYHKDIDFFGQKEMEELEMFDILRNMKNKTKRRRKKGDANEERKEMEKTPLGGEGMVQENGTRKE